MQVSHFSNLSQKNRIIFARRNVLQRTNWRQIVKMRLSLINHTFNVKIVTCHHTRRGSLLCCALAHSHSETSKTIFSIPTQHTSITPFTKHTHKNNNNKQTTAVSIFFSFHPTLHQTTHQCLTRTTTTKNIKFLSIYPKNQAITINNQ